jgi:hypothetical protein
MLPSTYVSHFRLLSRKNSRDQFVPTKMSRTVTTLRLWALFSNGLCSDWAVGLVSVVKSSCAGTVWDKYSRDRVNRHRWTNIWNYSSSSETRIPNLAAHLYDPEPNFPLQPWIPVSVAVGSWHKSPWLGGRCDSKVRAPPPQLSLISFYKVGFLFLLIVWILYVKSHEIFSQPAK